MRSRRNFFHSIINIKRSIITHQQDLLALQYLAPLSTSYLPWSQWAMHPSGLVAVLNMIMVDQFHTIVECGAGISTFYIARLLKERGTGHLLTIEHQRDWADLLRDKLKSEGLEDVASIVYAPLEPTELGLGSCCWYCARILEDIVGGIKINLLIVDGPPAYEVNTCFARYPAVPFFARFMAEDYAIILDDIDRDAEQEIVRRWEKYLGIPFERRFENGSIAIGRSNPS